MMCTLTEYWCNALCVKIFEIIIYSEYVFVEEDTVVSII